MSTPSAFSTGFNVRSNGPARAEGNTQDKAYDPAIRVMSPRKLNTGVLFRGPRHAFTRNQPGEIARSLCFHSDDSDCGPEAESRQAC